MSKRLRNRRCVQALPHLMKLDVRQLLGLLGPERHYWDIVEH